MQLIFNGTKNAGSINARELGVFLAAAAFMAVSLFIAESPCGAEKI